MNIPKAPRFEEGIAGLMRWAQKLADALTQRPSGQGVLSADYAITADETWEDTGLSVALPEAGTYLLLTDVRSDLDVSTSGYLNAKLYNATDSSDVDDSVRMLGEDDLAALRLGDTSPITTLVTVDGAKTIKLYAYRSAPGGGGSWNISTIRSDTSGKTTLAYVRIK